MYPCSDDVVHCLKTEYVEECLLNGGKTLVLWGWEKRFLMFLRRLRKSLTNVYWDSIFAIGTAFDKRKINVYLTMLRKTLPECLKSLTVNYLHKDASTFTERPLKCVALALQNFDETTHTVFYKRPEKYLKLISVL